MENNRSYLKARKQAKENERLWSRKKRFFNYGTMIVLLTGLALYPRFGNMFLVNFIIFFVVLFILFKKILNISD